MSDSIEKHIVLRAPLARVWRALTDPKEFWKWFGMELEGSFEPGTTLRGSLVYKGERLRTEFFVERIEPSTYLAYRWHPYAVDPQVDYSSEPTTLVEFRLSESEAGTELRITESGFEHIPQGRRAEAFRMDDAGWAQQILNIARHVTPV
jgi:uncharacterized protein YndB with AHSA1/START domain